MRSLNRRQSWPVLALHAWLALCLLLAQGLGHGHRSAHLSFRLAATALEQGATDAWGHALGSTDCQLFDQATHADQASGPDASSPLRVLDSAPAASLAPPSASVAGPRPCARGPPFLA